MGRSWGILFIEKGSQEEPNDILDSLCYSLEEVIEDLDEKKIDGEDGYNITRIIKVGEEKEFLSQRTYASLQEDGWYHALGDLRIDLFYRDFKSEGPFVDKTPLGVATSGARPTGLISWLPVSEIIKTQGKTEEHFLRYDLKLVKDFEGNWVTAEIQSGEFEYHYSDSLTRETPESVNIRGPENKYIVCYFQDDESACMSLSEAIEAGFFETKEAIWFLYHG